MKKRASVSRETFNPGIHKEPLLPSFLMTFFSFFFDPFGRHSFGKFWLHVFLLIGFVSSAGGVCHSFPDWGCIGGWYANIWAGVVGYSFWVAYVRRVRDTRISLVRYFFSVVLCPPFFFIYPFYFTDAFAKIEKEETHLAVFFFRSFFTVVRYPFMAFIYPLFFTKDKKDKNSSNY